MLSRFEEKNQKNFLVRHSVKHTFSFMLVFSLFMNRLLNKNYALVDNDLPHVFHVRRCPNLPFFL